MACCALQVVGYGPVKLVAQSLFHHVGDYRGNAAELCVAKGVTAALFGEKAAVGVARALGYHHGAIAELFDLRLHRGDKSVVIEIDFGK